MRLASVGRRLGLAVGVWATWLAAAPPASAQSDFPTDDSVRALVRRVVSMPPGVSVVVGLLDASGARRVVAVGDSTLDGRSLFEIGSITKVFTGTLLAYAVEAGEARLDQPVAELLPDSIDVPSRAGRQITLLNLATHTSGLPRMPTNMAPADWSNPYTDYTIAQLYQFLDGHRLERDIGDEPVYSNYGAALLGHALARRAGTTWFELARSRILGPLGMTNTFVAIPDSARPRLVPGYDGAGRPTSNWDLAEAFAGAGALRSGADDMLTFLAANIAAPESTVLGRAMRRATSRHPVGFANGGLHWGISESRHGSTMIGHGGGTGGYTTFVGFDPARRIGVVVLVNQAGSSSVPRVARHLLDPTTPASIAPLTDRFKGLTYVLAVLFVAGLAFAWRRTGASRLRVVVVTIVGALGVTAWLALTTFAGGLGLLADLDPPVMGLAVALMLAIGVALGASPVGRRLAALPLSALVGIHAFRLPLELLMYRAYDAGIMPREMSFAGWNYDVVTGTAALVLAALLLTGKADARAARWFNAGGALLLIVIMTIAALATPGPLHVLRTTPSNSWIQSPPFVWLPLFMVGLALLGHIVLYRHLRRSGTEHGLEERDGARVPALPQPEERLAADAAVGIRPRDLQ